MALQEHLDLIQPVDLTVIDGGVPDDYSENPFNHEVFADHDLIERKGVSVALENCITGADAQTLLTAYKRGYVPTNASTLSRQNLFDDEFLEELEDPTIIKYVARDEDGVPMGFMAVEKDLFREASPFWDPQDDDLLDEVQAAADPNAPSFYISTFLVDAESKNNSMIKTSEVILQGALKHFKEVCVELNANSLCFFDCAPANAFLPDYITKSGSPSKDKVFEGVGVTISPVYYSEWYMLPAAEFTDETLETIAGSLPDDLLYDQEAPRVTAEIPLEIQPENLEGDPDMYGNITNVGAIRDVHSAREVLREQLAEARLQGKKRVLFNLKRLADPAIYNIKDPQPKDPVPLGERLSVQTFSVMQLNEDPRTIAPVQ